MRSTLGCLALAAALAAPLAACGKVVSDPAATLPAPAVVATVASTTSTSTTVDPGALAQTPERPAASSPALDARLATLWKAIIDGQPAEAMPFFFPLSAYVQVKAVRDPAADWQGRLVANYDADLLALHRSVAAGATLLGLDVPASAVWVTPGVEFNRLSYWRVYGTRVRYSGGSFVIASMISWRGEWYVVHLLSIR